jgi:phage shock protein C
MTSNNKKLYRSRENRMIGGVCAGLGEFFGIDPTIVRLIFVLGSIFFGFPGTMVFIYLVMLLVVPEAPVDTIENS